MNNSQDYISKNKSVWNQKTDHHVDSAFYDNQSFMEGRNTLNSIELSLLGDVKGKSILHLQCHFGQDSLSLARMGAKVTGIDFSENAIAKAQELNNTLALNANFICCDVYETPKFLDQEFDLVFTSYGTIGWLPDLDRWAKVIHYSLKPGGKFVMADFHPVVWMMDNDFSRIEYSYFNVEPIVETETGTYANRDAQIQNTTVSWNHPTSELLNSLVSNDLALQFYDEFDYSPYNCFNKTEEFETGKFRIAHLGNKIPMVYALTAIKNTNIKK